MTPTQKALTTGFNASLKQRGVFVRLEPVGDSSPRWNALVQPIPPNTEQYPLSDEVRNYSIIYVLRTTVGTTEVEPGDTFLSDDGKTRFRVAKVEDNPQQVKLLFHCETTPVE